MLLYYNKFYKVTSEQKTTPPSGQAGGAYIEKNRADEL